MDLRPVFHLASADRWINDPCGLIHLDGQWHAYTQTNPSGVDWGNMSWGHATSTDLVHWNDQGVALECTERLDIFTGSTLLDTANLTGFGTTENPPLLAYWTAHHRPASPEAPREDQRLAVSVDGGASFTVPEAVNPVLTRHSTDFRDPKVFQWGDRHFVMVTVEANDRQVLIYTSADLLDWQLASTLGPHPTPAGIWECPSLVPLRAPGYVEDLWLLSFSAFGDDTRLPGTHYWLGDFDGRTFTPHDPAARPFDHGPDLYAVATFARTPPGLAGARQMAMGWLSNPVYAGQTPLLGADGSGGRGCLSLPRELGVVPDGAGWRLSQRVPDEVRARLGSSVIVTAEASPTGGDGSHESSRSGPDLVEPIGLVTLTFPHPVGEVVWDGIRLRRERGAVILERAPDPTLGERFPVTSTLRVAEPDEPLVLEVWVDRISVEVFLPTGEVWSATWYPREVTGWRLSDEVRAEYQPIDAPMDQT